MSAQAQGRKTQPFAVDLEKLLSPISVEHPSGELLRYAGTYDAIEEARREDDPSLPQGVWKTDLKKADWNNVMLICLEALETRSKDLQLAVWLLEAWTHLYGMSGVDQGLKLLNGLCESFWDDIHPRIEDDDDESRTAPLQWMNDKLSEKLKRVRITGPGTEDAPNYCWADWEGALHLAKLAKSDEAAAKVAEQKGRVNQQKFKVSVSLTPTLFFGRLSDDVQRAMSAVEALGSLLDAKCGEAAPSFRQFHNVLGEIRGFAESVLKDRMEEEQEVTVPEEEQGPESFPLDEDEPRETTFRMGPIKSRADAYRVLMEAAEYLERIEPHSPTPYLVKRAVSWGGMPVSELLAELLRDNADLRTVYKLLGIEPVETEHK